MKLDYDGTFQVARPAAEAFAFLHDPQQFAPLLPYFKELRDVRPEGFVLVLEIGVPQIRGKAEAKVQVLPPEGEGALEATYKGAGRHALGMVDARVQFRVEPADDAACAVHWRCESLVSGTLAGLAQGILAPLARRNIDQMVKSVQRALNGEEASEAEKAGLWSRMSDGVRRMVSNKESGE